MFENILVSTLFLIFLLSPFAAGDINKILESRHRPTIADLKRELTTEDILKDSSLQGDRDGDEILSRIESHAANLIAELEWAYPGAIYMPLGRDSVWAGDLIDAFYQAYGQKDRVKRLNASGQSLFVKEELIARWIESLGIDIKNLAKGPSYIMFDYSAYNLPSKSQSTKILTAVYNAYTRQGGQAKDILTKFSFFNTAFLINHIKVDPLADRNKLLLEQYNYLKENPNSIPQRTFSANSRFTVAGEWHEEFGPITEMPDGTVVAPPPAAPNDLNKRKYILKLMHKIMDLVAKPEFLEMVKARAKELGYEFKIHRQTCDDSLKLLKDPKEI